MGHQQVQQAFQARGVRLPAAGHEAGGELHADGVDVLVLVQDPEQPLQLLRLAAEANGAAHVQRVAIAAPDDVEEGGQLLVAGVREQGHLQPRPREGVRDHHRLAARHRHQPHAPAGARLAAKQHLQHIDGVVHALGGQGARLPHDALPHGVRGRERGGVRGGGAGARLGDATLPDDDGLELAGAAKRSDEAAAVLHALHVHGDDLGIGVIGKVVDIIRDVQHLGVPHADRGADAHPLGSADQAEVDGVGAGLGDEAHRPRLARRLLARLAHPQLRAVEPHAVRADEGEAGLAGDAPDLRLEARALLLARLGEAGGEQGDAAHSLRGAVGDDAGGDGARHGADDVVDLVRHVGQRWVVGHAQLLDAGDLGRIDLYRVDLPLEATHVAQPHVAVRPLVADDGQGARVEDARQVVPRVRHGLLSGRANAA